jgi:threonine/homoserine/homoserine lactone efflux protein
MTARSTLKRDGVWASVLLIVGEVVLTSLFVVGAAVGLTAICVVVAVVFEVMR